MFVLLLVTGPSKTLSAVAINNVARLYSLAHFADEPLLPALQAFLILGPFG